MVGLTTPAAAGQSVFNVPSEVLSHVWLPDFSSVKLASLIRLKYFLKMCVVPAPSRRTTGMIGLAQPLPVNVSPSSVIWFQFLGGPRKMLSSVTLFSTSRPLSALLVAVQFAGRFTITAIAV